MTKVAILKSHLQQLGGLERYALAIARQFIQSGCDVTILTSGELSLKESPIDILSLTSHRGGALVTIPKFNLACSKWLKNNPHDLIFGLDRNSDQTHYRAGNGVHKYYLQHKAPNLLKKYFHAVNPKDRLIMQCEKKLFTSPNLKLIFANSQMVKKQLIEEFGLKSNKIQVVYNGVDFDQLQFTENSKEQACIRLKLDPSAHQILFIGHGFERKGLHRLLKALSHLKAYNFQLNVIGTDRQLSHYKQMAKSLYIEDRVFFRGRQTVLTPFYQASDLFVLPTIYDPFANVTLEALAMGLKIITTSFNGASEILPPTDGNSISDFKTEENLVRALSKQLESKPTFLYRSMIRKAVSHLELKKQMQKIVSKSLATI